MKIVCISDTHSIHHPSDLPDGDMLIHAGDLSMTGAVHEIQSGLAWLRKFPHRYKIVIGGNHDNDLQNLPIAFDEQWKAYRDRTPLIYLCGSMIEVEGYKIFGSPILPFKDVYRPGARAFMLHTGTQHHWGNAPDCDILVTHGPPQGMRDSGYGDPHLMWYVDKVKPKLHVFGHVHAAYGVSDFKGTKFVNAALIDDSYRPKNEPIVVEV